MTKAKAIYLLRNTAWLAPSGTLEQVEEAVEMAIDALCNAHPTHECVEPTHECVELISRRAAIRAFAEYEKRTTPLWSMAYQETLEEWIDEVTETLSDIPTIDLVHCRECEHWEMLDDDSDRGGCYYWMSVEEYKTSRADDFCSYGERRER